MISQKPFPTNGRKWRLNPMKNTTSHSGIKSNSDHQTSGDLFENLRDYFDVATALHCKGHLAWREAPHYFFMRSNKFRPCSFSGFISRAFSKYLMAFFLSGMVE